jgi:hypothetical protein
VQLTGTIGAGETYVIAHLASTFNAAYPGKTFDLESSIIGTDGGWDYYLSLFGEHTVGDPIDFYSSDFDGKHAVRHYEIVAPATSFDATEWVIFAAENMDMTPGSHRMDLTWDGDGSKGTEWRDTSNWTMPYVPDAGHNAVVPNGGEPVPVIGLNDNAFCHDLTIGGARNGAGLIIESVSAPGRATSEDGSLITYGTVTGPASVQRYIGADRYYYVTQPVTTALAGVFLHTWLFTYLETAGDWTAFIEDENTALTLMQGYAVWSSSTNSYDPGLPPIGDTTVAYEGVLNTGDQSMALTYTANGAAAGDGWNFVGNPYPSAVDWEADGWTWDGLATFSFAVWDGSDYATYSQGGGSTNGGTQYIPAAQGFFVETDQAGTLGMNNGVRTHSTQTFWKGDEIMTERLSLTISNGEIDDETVIYFNENASSDLDKIYDASKLMALAAPQAYTMLVDKKMAINTFNNIGENSSVRMGINAPETGEYTITASNIESFDASTPIYLEDLYTQAYVDLRESSSYTFTAEEGTEERFIVHFLKTQGIDDPVNEEISNIYAFQQDVYVNFNGTRGEISIYNILGQEISRTVATNGMNVLSVPQGNSVYIVKVVTDNVSVTKKVFVK